MDWRPLIPWAILALPRLDGGVMSSAEPTWKTKVVDLGPETSFAKFPAPVSIGKEEYFLARGKDGAYRLLSAVCPHRWGRIVQWDTCFLCPDHGWRFEFNEGICINGPNARMYAVTVTERDGRLYAEVPLPS
jgi:nitrite reductase/ring-hydroxylating ferredoxin subunit